MMYAVLYRSLFSLLTSFAVSVALGLLALPLLRSLYGGGAESVDAEPLPAKSPVPSMGGVVIFAAILLSSLVFGSAGYRLLLIALLIAGLFAALGFADDFFGILRKADGGLHPWIRLAAEAMLSLGFGVLLYFINDDGGSIWLDKLPIGAFYVPFAALVIWGTVAAVRRSVAPDGFGATVTGIYALFLTVLLCIAVVCAPATANPTRLLNLSALSVSTAAVAGGCLGFLLFGAYPKQLDMGSTGAYLLGGAIAGTALLSGTALLLPLVGVCLVCSAGLSLYEAVSKRLSDGPVSKAAKLRKRLFAREGAAPRIVSICAIVTTVCSAGALLLYWFFK